VPRNSGYCLRASSKAPPRPPAQGARAPRPPRAPRQAAAVTAPQPAPGRPRPSRVCRARRLQTRPARSPAGFPSPPPGGCGAFPPFPGPGQAGPSWAAGLARAATARPLSRTPSRARRRSRGLAGGRARRRGRARQEPVPAALRGPPWPRLLLRLCDRRQPSEPPPPPRCAPGCKWRPPASAPPAALGPGSLRAARRGPHPHAASAATVPAVRVPRRRPQSGSRAAPAAPTPRPLSARAAPRRAQPLTAGRGAPAGRARRLRRIPGSRQGRDPLPKP
jgi:hypothetical protein